MVKIEINKTAKGVELQPVSGRTLAHMRGATTISEEDFEDASGTNVETAINLLKKCGYTTMKNDFKEFNYN